MFTPFNSLFFLKATKHGNEKFVPVYLRITVAGKRAEISIRKKVLVSEWTIAPGRMKGHTEKARKFNFFLSTIQSRLHDAYLELSRDGHAITATSLKKKFLGAEETKRTLISIFQNHNSQIALLVPEQYSPATLERYKTSLSHTIEFLESKYNASDINIKSINHEFISDYDFFLRSVRKCSNNTTVKYIKNFKKIIKICIANGWINDNPFIHYKARLKEVHRTFLSELELQKLTDKQFDIERLCQIKDVFLFSCLQV